MKTTKFFVGDLIGLSKEIEHYFNSGIIEDIKDLKISVMDEYIEFLGVDNGLFMITFNASDLLKTSLEENKNIS